MTEQGTFWHHLSGAQRAPRYKSLAHQAKAAECYETPRWAAAAILRVELLTRVVLDPCCGTGVLSEAALDAGYVVISQDLHDWGYKPATADLDFLRPDFKVPKKDFSVFMNPPFSKACEFIDRARSMRARKIVCFQRQAWRECETRRRWWEENPPARVWTCGDRATCWLFTVPPQSRTGKSTSTPYAWYVWERGHRGAELGGAIYRDT